MHDEDISYLLSCANHPISQDDICGTFLGITPLVIDKHDETDATGMSRDYKIDVIRKEETRLIHVYGGKLTTCLSMAEKVAALV